VSPRLLEPYGDPIYDLVTFLKPVGLSD